jgi:hypothetical protein
MPSILDSLPSLYRGVFPSFFQSSIPPHRILIDAEKPQQ